MHYGTHQVTSPLGPQVPLYQSQLLIVPFTLLWSAPGIYCAAIVASVLIYCLEMRDGDKFGHLENAEE